MTFKRSEVLLGWPRELAVSHTPVWSAFGTSCWGCEGVDAIKGEGWVQIYSQSLAKHHPHTAVNYTYSPKVHRWAVPPSLFPMWWLRSEEKQPCSSFFTPPCRIKTQRKGGNYSPGILYCNTAQCEAVTYHLAPHHHGNEIEDQAMEGRNRIPFPPKLAVVDPLLIRWGQQDWLLPIHLWHPRQSHVDRF